MSHNNCNNKNNSNFANSYLGDSISISNSPSVVSVGRNYRRSGDGDDDDDDEDDDDSSSSSSGNASLPSISFIESPQYYFESPPVHQQQQQHVDSMFSQMNEHQRTMVPQQHYPQQQQQQLLPSLHQLQLLNTTSDPWCMSLPIHMNNHGGSSSIRKIVAPTNVATKSVVTKASSVAPPLSQKAINKILHIKSLLPEKEFSRFELLCGLFKSGLISKQVFHSECNQLVSPYKKNKQQQQQHHDRDHHENNNEKSCSQTVDVDVHSTDNSSDNSSDNIVPTSTTTVIEATATVNDVVAPVEQSINSSNDKTVTNEQVKEFIQLFKTAKSAEQKRQLMLDYPHMIQHIAAHKKKVNALKKQQEQQAPTTTTTSSCPPPSFDECSVTLVINGGGRRGAASQLSSTTTLKRSRDMTMNATPSQGDLESLEPLSKRRHLSAM